MKLAWYKTEDEINQMLSDRENKLGVTEEIKNAPEVVWNNIDLSELSGEDTGIHRYELIIENATWTEAYNRCISRGGYLVHINTEEENEAIMNQIIEENKTEYTFWLGAARSATESFVYRWVNKDGSFGLEGINRGNYVDFWLPGEPSFNGENSDGERVDEMYVDLLYQQADGKFYWNDVPEDLISAAGYLDGKIGYICEYED